MIKLAKRCITACALAVLIGVLCFGSGFLSYAGSSLRGLRRAVEQDVPVEVELERARDLLSGLVPEIQGQVVAVAREEVAVEAFGREVARRRAYMAGERRALEAAREELGRKGGAGGNRAVRVAELSRRFANLQLGEELLERHEKLLAARKQSLAALEQNLREAQIRKVELEALVEELTHRLRLMKFEEETLLVRVDTDRLDEVETLVSELRKRCTVAERLLAFSAGETVSTHVPRDAEAELLAKIDEYLGGETAVVLAPARKEEGRPVATP
jgi:hypothetical protein